MNFQGWINLIGIPAIVIALLYIGRKLQVLDELKKTTDKMKFNLKIISDYLTKQTKFDPKELQVMSPLKLTDAGVALITNTGFNNIFSEHRSDFFSIIDSESPKLKYDVENAAIKSILFLQDNPYMNFLKVFLYNNPNRTIENIAPTFGIYVRDKYLEEHPEITQ